MTSIISRRLGTVPGTRRAPLCLSARPRLTLCVCSVADMVPGLGAIATQPPVAPVETYSLSSYFDVATAKGGKKKTPKKAEAAAKTAAEAASSFDDDLVSPAVAMIRAQPEASPFTDEEVIQAVR